MTSENQIDLEVALRKLHELALEDGDLGYEYWHRVAQLLRRAADMTSEIEALSQELKKCRAKQGKSYRRSSKETLARMPDVETDEDGSCPR